MIDYTELEQELARMKPRQRLYELIKAEMISRGRWKNLARGKPFKIAQAIKKPVAPRTPED